MALQTCNMIQGAQEKINFTLKSSNDKYVTADDLSDMEVTIGSKCSYTMSGETNKITYDSSTYLWSFLVTEEQTFSLPTGLYTIFCRPVFKPTSTETNSIIPALQVGYLQILQGGSKNTIAPTDTENSASII